MPDWTLFDPEANTGLFTGADAVFRAKIRPLIVLFDRLQSCLDDLEKSADAAKKRACWARAEGIHREIMTRWRLSFFLARRAVDAHLAKMGLNSSLPEHESLRNAVHKKCRPTTKMAFILLQFDDLRSNRPMTSARRS
ncbi:hypothetical protein OSJ77_07705 [Phyllobacterium sp. 0TCS1.6C]|uniref:hypothetical protein n=1 Tax=unclassified Phyllobacterium TaxID=2638441 RepID=UPI002264469E|nr:MULTISPECIES: hypothetical protein [unclassified Phyllobacterium]MCX8280070.1 hypothetical protein [Phyllobacterium sp. 0TCS1.6C]MCX8294368.1 hypothetical protein [Phyllobacterium sp. 0TCS1.6A]